MKHTSEDYAHLSASERLELIAVLWDSLSDEPSSIPLTSAQREELDRRLNALLAGDMPLTDWNTVQSHT